MGIAGGGFNAALLPAWQVEHEKIVTKRRRRWPSHGTGRSSNESG